MLGNKLLNNHLTGNNFIIQMYFLTFQYCQVETPSIVHISDKFLIGCLLYPKQKGYVSLGLILQIKYILLIPLLKEINL